jgi:hypothetical protein
MTNEEKIRLNEIIFCNLFKSLLKTNTNPIKVYDFITALADVIGANKLILNNVLTIILNNDKHYMATKKEYIYLLRKSNVPVRQIVAMTHISMTTYYDERKFFEMHIEPKFDPIQYAEMLKVLMFFNDTKTSIEGGELIK